MNSENRAGRVRLDIYLPSGTDGVQLKNKIRDVAVNQGRTVSGWVNDAIQEKLYEMDSSTVGMKMAAGLLIALGPEFVTAVCENFSAQQIDSLTVKLRLMMRDREMHKLFLKDILEKPEQNPSSSHEKSLVAMAEKDPAKVAGIIRKWIEQGNNASYDEPPNIA